MCNPVASNATANQSASGTTLTGSSIQWYTSTTGNVFSGTLLGTGASYTVPGGTLATGAQYIMCVATDSKYHGYRTVVSITGH